MGNQVRKAFYKRSYENLVDVPNNFFDIEIEDCNGEKFKIEKFRQNTKLYLIINIDCA